MNPTPTERALRLGTRASRLARSQSQQVADRLTELTGRSVELINIATHGDATTAPLHTLGGQGVFTSALREALLEGRIDFAVHSLKDLPTAPATGLTLAAIPQRADPRDALVARDGRTLVELPAGSTIGTGSLRRSAQIRALRLGVELVGLRGNVDTRLSKVTSGELDAVVLACAGLHRIGRAEVITEALDPAIVLPAPGQGALAIEARADDDAMLDLLKSLDDHYSRISVTAERALLAALEAGCSSPVGALAEVTSADDGHEISLRGSVTAIDGSNSVRLSATGPLTDAAGVGERLARLLLDDGAAELMGSSR